MSEYMREDFQEFEMPSGAVVYYRDPDHSYWGEIKPKRKTKPEGEWQGVQSSRMTGVTSVVEPFGWDSTNPLMGWAVRINLEGVAELVRREVERVEQESAIGNSSASLELGWLMDPDQIKARLKSAQLRDEDVKEEAGERGSNVHLHTLNALAAGMPVPATERLTEEERGYSMAVTQFWLDHEPDALQAEQVVFDPGLRVAGRLDFRGFLRSRCRDPKCPCKTLSPAEIVVLDLKTSNYVGRTAFVQARGYDLLCRIAGFGKAERCFIVKAKEDGSYRLIESPATGDDFLSALEMYRRGKALDQQATAMAKALEAV